MMGPEKIVEASFWKIRTDMLYLERPYHDTILYH